ncbi:hypothetical protein Micbo1qcDRAFT_167267, partial [Microdochium bolleyi]
MLAKVRLTMQGRRMFIAKAFRPLRPRKRSSFSLFRVTASPWVRGFDLPGHGNPSLPQFLSRSPIPSSHSDLSTTSSSPSPSSAVAPIWPAIGIAPSHVQRDDIVFTRSVEPRAWQLVGYTGRFKNNSSHHHGDAADR